MTVFSRLFKLFIYVIITPLFVTGVFLFYYQDYSKKEILENYHSLAKVSSSFIKQNIENISLRFDFVNNLTGRLADEKGLKSAREDLDLALANSPDFVFLAVLDETGKEIIRSAPKEISANIPAMNLSEDVFFKSMRPDNIAVSDFNANAPFPLVEIIYPAKDGKFLFAVVNLYSVWDKFSAQKIGRTGGIYFANIEEGFLAFNNKYVPRVLQADIAAVLKSGSSSIKELRTLEGDKLVGAFTGTPLPGTYLFVLQYYKEAYYTINLITWLIVFFILATTTLSYFAALSFSQEISEPIEKLTAAAEKISQNDFNISLDEGDAWGEFEILIKTVNAMAASLSHYQALQLDKILDEKRKTDMLARLMRDGVIMCTAAGEKLFVNKTAAKILESGAVLPDGKKLSVKDLLKTKSGTVFTYKEGSAVLHFEIVAEFFKPANEESVAIIILRDITTEHEINRMKNDIFNSIAHDLRAPLLGLQAYIMIMQEAAPEPEKQKEILNSMEQSSKTLTNLIEDILDASKLERGLISPVKAKVNLYNTAAKVTDTLLPLAHEKNTEIKNSVPETTVVTADKNLLERVFSNLLSNAIKFTDKGLIEISYARKDGLHRITVSDDGCGIKESELSKIFDKYQQSSSARKGYGLGLNITKQIINAHGGEIEVASAEGKGSAFTFTLPVSAGKDKK